MRCALVLFSNAAFKGIFRIQVLESAGIDRFCHLLFSPANLAGISKLRTVVAVGLQMWESRQRFPSLALCARRHVQAIRLRLLVVLLAGDKLLL
jgi:hypothetical protein